MKQSVASAIIQPFWELTRCGLWEQVPDPMLFCNLDEKDWQQLIRLIDKQTVTGICFAAMQRLPDNYRPMRSVYLEWYTRVLQIIRQHQHLLDTYRQLNIQFESKGIFPVLLKGIGIASYYPEPSLRMTGDIDLYIPEHFHAVIDELQRQGIKILHQNSHDKFEYNSTWIELHSGILHLPARMTEANSWPSMSAVSIQYEGMACRIPDNDTNAALLLAHPFKHLFSWGIGVRHLCDWALFLHHNHDRTHLPKVKDYIRKVHMEPFVSTFTSLAMEKLGLSHTIASPWVVDCNNTCIRRLEEDMLDTGDIGNEIVSYSRMLEAAPSSLENTRLLMRLNRHLFARLFRLYPISPYYARRCFLRKIREIYRKLTKDSG